MWGRLGYPRRALRLHDCASAIVRPARRRRCPPTWTSCWRCPASATTPRGRWRLRVRPAARRWWTPTCAGWWRGRSAARGRRAHPRPAGTWPRCRRCCRDDPAAARASAAFMELGALVCTARAPRCPACPLAEPLRLAAGRAARRYQGPRGAAAAVRRHRPAGARAAAGGAARRRRPGARRPRWTRSGPTPSQRARALAGLLADGLVDPLPRRPVRASVLIAASGHRAARDAGGARSGEAPVQLDRALPDCVVPGLRRAVRRPGRARPAPRPAPAARPWRRRGRSAWFLDVLAGRPRSRPPRSGRAAAR